MGADQSSLSPSEIRDGISEHFVQEGGQVLNHFVNRLSIIALDESPMRRPSGHSLCPNRFSIEGR